MRQQGSPDFRNCLVGEICVRLWTSNRRLFRAERHEEVGALALFLSTPSRSEPACSASHPPSGRRSIVKSSCCWRDRWTQFSGTEPHTLMVEFCMRQFMLSGTNLVLPASKHQCLH